MAKLTTTEKENHKIALVGMFTLPLLLIVGWLNYGFNGLLLFGIPLLIVETELIYYLFLLDHKKRCEGYTFSVGEHKGVSILGSLILFLPYLFVAHILKNISRVIQWFIKYWIEILLSIGITVGIIAIVILFIIWCKYNERLARKHLGKNRIRF